MGQKASKKLVEPSMVSTENALAEYYAGKVLPLEKRHLFEDFDSPPMDPAEFQAKPTILVLGHYSVGKTSMITYLLGEEYPGAAIGPEPTTDVFVFVQHGSKADSVPGAALVSDRDFPYRAVAKFGTDFLNKLRGASVPVDILKSVNFIDTPGILAGEKQRNNRGYDFHRVVKFLAEKVDRIWVLFDTAKMDISDEYKMILNNLAGNDEKVRIILNKADAVTGEELVRVRGALMWNLGKIFRTPEVPTVIIGSFVQAPPKRHDLREAFLHDYKALIKEIRDLPVTCPIRKINDLVKRARRVEVHALLMDAIVKHGPTCACSGRQGAVKKWTQPLKMKILFAELEIREKVAANDFPDPAEFAASAALSNPKKWARIRVKERKTLRDFITEDVPAIVDAAKTSRPAGPDPAEIVDTPDGLAFLSDPKHSPRRDKDSPTSASTPNPSTRTAHPSEPSAHPTDPSTDPHRNLSSVPSSVPSD